MAHSCSQTAYINVRGGANLRACNFGLTSTAMDCDFVMAGAIMIRQKSHKRKRHKLLSQCSGMYVSTMMRKGGHILLMQVAFATAVRKPLSPHS